MMAVSWSPISGAASLHTLMCNENDVRSKAFRRLAATSTAMLLIALVAPAKAQKTMPVSEQSADRTGSVGLEDIVVTARRKEENLQSVPVAVTAVSQDALTANNVTTVRELQTLVPSLTIMASGIGGDTANFIIRGQGSGGGSPNPAVAVYINEVPLQTEYDGSLPGGPGLMFDLENVQVLKGPQGTLFGRNTMGGAILLQTTRPKDEFGGRLQIGYGNYDNREIEGAVNVPLVPEKLLARVAFTAQKRDGYTHVISTPDHPDGLDIFNRDAWSVRGTLSFRPSDTFQNDLIGTYSTYKGNGFAVRLLATSGLAAADFAQQQQLGPRTMVPLSVPMPGTGGNLLSLQNITTVELGENVRFRNIIGYQLAKWVFDGGDLDGSSLRILDLVNGTYRSRQISEEAQIQGTSFDGRLEWVFGGFFHDQRPPRNQPAPNMNDLELIGIDLRDIGGPLDMRLRGRTSTSQAIYAQGTFAITPELRVTGGVRYTWDERTQFGQDIATGVALPTQLVKNKAPTWTVGVDYKLSRDILLYLTSRRGYRAGGISSVGSVVIPYDSESVTDFEGGIKADWTLAGMPMRTNGALYYQKYSDIQVSATRVLDTPNGPVIGTVITNGATARIWGGELELTASPTPDLQLSAYLSYLNFKFTNVGAGVDAMTLARTGKNGRVPWTYGVNGRYKLPIDPAMGQLSFQANYAWRDSTIDSGGVREIPSYGIVNASLNLNDIAQSGFDASIFVSNLTNKLFQASGSTYFGISTGVYGEPRMYGIRLGYRFGSERR